MANTVFKLRRSSVAGKVPNTSTLSIGELGLNITDRKLYSSDGTNVWETGANLTTLAVSTNTTVNNVIISGGVYANSSYGTANQVLTTNGSGVYWSTVTSGVGVNTNAQYVWANTQTFNANITVNTGIIANGNIGSSGQTLTSNGSSVYWSTIVTTVPVFQSFTGDGSTTSFTVTGGYTPNVVNVFVNGIKYSASSVTTSSGTSIVFGTAPPNGAIIEVVGYLNSLTAAVNTAAQYTWTNTQTFNSNLVIGSSVFANGSTGTSGQALTTNGTAVYWSTIVGTNTDAQYIWSNTQTFTNTITFNSVIAGTANNANYLGGTAASGYQTTAGLASNVGTLTSNSTLYVGTVSAANVVSNAQLSSNLANYVTTTNLTNNLANYQTTAGLSANVATLTANNTSFVGTVAAVNVVSNAQLSSNLANYVTSTNLTNNLANYQTTAGLASNVATLTANNTSFVGTVSAANVVSNAQLSSNLANYVTTTNLTNNLANYQTTAGLASNVAGLTANNTSFVGTVAAANVVSNAQLSSNLANYALLSGATFTGNVTANNANTVYDLNVGRNLYVSGNLTIGSNVNIIGANNLSVIDNMIYLNSNSNWANPDLGFAANYNDGTYHHTGFFRDHSDGKWKVFDNYLPEPDANIYIQTSNTTFHLADFQANTLYAGNTSVNWAVVNASGIYSTGTVNATSFTVGTSTIANSLGVYTTTSNATTFSAGATGTGTGGFVANSTLVFVGNNTVNAAINTTSLYIGGNVIANSTGANNAFNLNNQPASYYTNATNITTGTLPYAQLGSAVVNTSGNFTLAGNTTFSGTFVNAASYNAGAIGTGTGGSVQNTTIFFVGNNTVNAYLNTTGLNVNAATIANTLGVYTTGTINAASHTVGTSFSVNSTVINIGSLGVYANSGLGTSGQVLTSNGTATYWAAAAAGVNTAAQYTWTNTHTFNGNVVLGSGLSANGSYGTASQVLTSNGTATYWSTFSNTSNIEIRQQYSGDGACTVFTVTGGYTPYKLSVYVNGVLLRGNTDVLINSGSTFTILPAPESGALIDAIGITPSLFTSNMPVTQTFTGDGSTTTFTVAGGYLPGTLNVYGNGVRYTASEVTTSSGTTIVFGTAPPNGVIIDVIGVTPVVALNTSVRQSFTGTGACTTFTVSGGYTPGNIDVYMNGIKLANSEIVTTSGSSVVFNTAPPNNSVIDVVGLNNGLTSAYNAPVRQSFTGTGACTTFTVVGGYTPGNLDVYGNGVKYASSEVTTSSGSTIVFGTAPPSGVVIDVVGYYLNNLSVGNAGAIRQTFTGDGSTTTFTVAGGYNPNNIDVYGNGIKYPSSDVTTSSGSSIVFAVAPPNGVNIDVVGYYINNLTTVNTAQAYTWTGPHTFNANVTMSANLTIATTAGLKANGSVGTTGQVLTSNGSSAYWATATTDPTPTAFLLMGA